MSFRCLNYGSSPPSRCHRPRGEGETKSEAMFHLRRRGIFKIPRGAKEEGDAGLLHRRDPTDASSCLSLSLAALLFFLFASFCFAAVFKIRHLNKSILMAAMQRRWRWRRWEEEEERRHNLITVTVLFNELKASGSDSRSVYYFVLARYMVGKGGWWWWWGVGSGGVC